MKKIRILIIIVLLSVKAFADEGMWIPMLLGKYTIADMQSKGFRLTAEDIYSVNKACLKDAVMIFGGGCTGELVSDKGLVLTNHHCGYGAIQSQSSLEHDYLTDGFWARSNKDEISIPGLTVTFLVYMEDVSEKVLANITPEMNESRRQYLVSAAIEKIKRSVPDNEKYKIVIKPFYYGNEYYMFVYEIFTDVRLVGAPPSSIGKFGGDTDNWMWPRHTGDFSMFRIYADKDNKPAKYSPGNVPYTPKKYFKISLKGYKENDFTMVLGYPGTTSEYISSDEVRMISEKENPFQVKLREKRLEIMDEYMKVDKEVRIKYSSKYANVANAWKKWIGEDRGLAVSGAINTKLETEKKFTEWCNGNEQRKAKYGKVLDDYHALFEKYSPDYLALNFAYETFYALEIVKFAGKFTELTSQSKTDTTGMWLKVKNIKPYVGVFFKDYYPLIDKKIMVDLLKMYHDRVDKSFYPGIYSFIEKKFKNNFGRYADYVFSKSVFADKNKLNDFLDNFNSKSLKDLEKDPALKLYLSVSELINNRLSGNFNYMNMKLDSLGRIYISGLKEMQTDKLFYPDANSTMRVAYGNIHGYTSTDAVNYEYFTTLDGVMEKENPDIYDYKVSPKLKELYLKKDYGRYSENGIMHVCFIAKNHTSGGNSGSPVINDNGDLIGINFDRNWEGTMSDIMYNPDICRNIVLDIRYVLFIIDKYAGATNLVDEMKFS